MNTRRLLALVLTVLILTVGLYNTSMALSTENGSGENSKSAADLSSKQLGTTHAFSAITLGTGSPEYAETKANASTIIQYQGKYYIVDCGDGSYGKLLSSGIDFKNIGGILLTHHHIDHTTDFFDIYVKCVLSGSKDFVVVGPPRTKSFVDFVNTVYLDDILYRMSNTSKDPSILTKKTLSDFAKVTEIIGTNQFALNGLTVKTAEMSHTMYNLAYKFEAADKSIVVSGDTSYNEDLVSLSTNADLLVVDGTYHKALLTEKPSKRQGFTPIYGYGANFSVSPHMTFDEMVQAAIKSNVSTLIVTHTREVPQERIDTSIAKIKESFKGEVYYAYDGAEYGVPGTEWSNQIAGSSASHAYSIVDTQQTDYYSDTAKIPAPKSGDRFYGQDATYQGNQPSYSDNQNGTITDQVTGLMWAKDLGAKMTYSDAVAYAQNATLGGYDDWRLPSIKELYSLIQFNGQVTGTNATNTLFIDTDYFNQPLGNTAIGEREIDAQTWSSTFYAGKTMGSDETLFGVNFIDGRIKGYPTTNKRTRTANKMYFRLVRGNTSYGINQFADNHDGTITDLATGLTWQQADSGIGMNWENALKYAENLTLAGHDDWRLPNSKELQSIVDYNRSLQTTGSAAINSLFKTTAIKDTEGKLNYPYYWTGTTHLDGPNPNANAVYIAFGEALGQMNGKLMDVHGAGAQRSDPKSGSTSSYPTAVGPQGDIRMVYNFVRCVRN